MKNCLFLVLLAGLSIFGSCNSADHKGAANISTQDSAAEMMAADKAKKDSLKNANGQADADAAVAAMAKAAKENMKK